MSNAHFLKHLKGPGTLHSSARVFNSASSHSEFGLCIHLPNEPGYAQPVPNRKNILQSSEKWLFGLRGLQTVSENISFHGKMK